MTSNRASSFMHRDGPRESRRASVRPAPRRVRGLAFAALALSTLSLSAGYYVGHDITGYAVSLGFSF
jgi:hypothetical protein